MKRTKIEHETWLDLSEAAEFLGVHFTTLRRWADSGAVPFMRTPGGRRRFSIKALEHFLQHRSFSEGTFSEGAFNEGATEQATEQALEPVSERALVHARQTVRSLSTAKENWMGRLSSEQREQMRGTGNRLTALLLQYNSRSDGGEAFLDEGKRIMREYSLVCWRIGLSLKETVHVFLFFRRSILDAVYETGYLGGSEDQESQRLFHRTMDFMDGLLIDLIGSYERAQTELSP